MSRPCLNSNYSHPKNRTNMTITKSIIILSLGLAAVLGGCGPPPPELVAEWSATAQIMSAAQGDAEAQFQVGHNFFEGRGGATDYEMAVIWFRKAAEQGDAWSTNYIKEFDELTELTEQGDAQA